MRTVIFWSSPDEIDVHEHLTSLTPITATCKVTYYILVGHGEVREGRSRFQRGFTIHYYPLYEPGRVWFGSTSYKKNIDTGMCRAIAYNEFSTYVGQVLRSIEDCPSNAVAYRELPSLTIVPLQSSSSYSSNGFIRPLLKRTCASLGM